MDILHDNILFVGFFLVLCFFFFFFFPPRFLSLTRCVSNSSLCER